MKRFRKSSLTILAASFLLILSGPVAALAAGPEPVNLLSAGNFTVLAKSGISTTGTTFVTGDIGVSPAAATFITGFSLVLPSASTFATSSKVSGKIYAPGYANPTPAIVTAAVSDMESAYTTAAGRTNPTATELGAGNIGGMTLAPGLYKWGTGVTIPADVTLSGGANDVWIFQIAQTLTVSSAAKVILAGGAQASNVFWIVAGQTTIGTGAAFNGNILDKTAIVLNTGATLNGRALAQTAVTLDANAITAPSAGNIVTNTTPISTQVSSPDSTPVTTYSSTTTTTMPLPPVHAPGSEVRLITVNLAKGSRGTNVTTLQQFLISQNTGKAAQALAHVGATSYFGSLTVQALAEFQTSVGISPAYGNFGSVTRAFISAHY